MSQAKAETPCVICPGFVGDYEALGHRLCIECFERYRTERREQQAFKDRVFLQAILRAGYQLGEAAV